MSEEEKRRCIILGICGDPPPGLAADNGTRRFTLAGYLADSTLTDDDLDRILGLIDEALSMSTE